MSSNHALALTPFGSVTATLLFAADTLQNVGRHSSVWQIVDAFLRVSEGVAERIAEGPRGFILLVGVPGKQNTGAFYLYQKASRTFFSLDFEAQDAFSPMSFDAILQVYSLNDLIIGGQAADKAEEAPSKGRQQRARRPWYHNRKRSTKPAAAVHAPVHQEATGVAHA